MRLEDIIEEIEKLEQADFNCNNVQKLSWLYIVRDHMKSPVKGTMPDGESEFRQCSCGKDIESVMLIIDEMMEATQVLNPRMYENVLARIGEI